MTWIRTATQYRDQLHQSMREVCDLLVDDGGIGVVEWLCLETGTRVVAAAEGSWETGGELILLHFDQSGAATKLRPDEGKQHNTAYPQGDPSAWQDAKDRVIEAVERMLGLAHEHSSPIRRDHA